MQQLWCFICKTFDFIPFIISFICISMALLFWYIKKYKRTDKQLYGEQIEILVQHGFHPNSITIDKKRTTRFTFMRLDPSDCFEEIIVPAFDIKRRLPYEHKVGFEITPHKSGVFAIYCNKNIQHGTIIVL